MRLRELLDALHPADVADLLGFLSEDYREQVIPWIPSDAIADILPDSTTTSARSHRDPAYRGHRRGAAGARFRRRRRRLRGP
ncbi:MAG: hypothetical protein WDN06_14080 [Asticcacaulis sp.]